MAYRWRALFATAGLASNLSSARALPSHSPKGLAAWHAAAHPGEPGEPSSPRLDSARTSYRN
eukprot:1475363-Pyramimonas_sp.AAC.1